MICRGCAGIGIGIQVPPRTIAIIEGVMSYEWGFDPPVSSAFAHPRPRYLVVGHMATPGRLSTVTALPYATALKRAESLLAKGFTYAEDCIPMNPAWTCEWCHGTGKPQLSVGTMGMAVRG